jgi:hypothetical protein
LGALFFLEGDHLDEWDSPSKERPVVDLKIQLKVGRIAMQPCSHAAMQQLYIVHPMLTAAAAGSAVDTGGGYGG